METETHVFFYGHTPNKSGTYVFSQWFPISFTDETGQKYQNTEQYMMAQKAILFGDDVYLNKILSTDDPKKIKEFGRKISNFDAAKWDENKFEIVVNGNRLKFGQNMELLNRLLKTEKKTIVEASPYDKIWGIGLRPEKAAKTPETEWPGQNLLGKALMKVRDEFSQL